ncbi:phenylalanine--tRNA ligase subunit alpha [Hymenobacter weizhouensis]|uniref:phenylalanine--tRNA ligase subunit alpha n=1 Tax=Hymenobacter sp. YIM 151500-1 TaxID=2987689 RepID=UPI0022277443|nr:phenylalanine--tRNA ligase subunit alpha [Hymenobacter sp. YIM 151500-1]UYZ65240.1 phenylalanine--tRNA ligase subunit alpha [Hymenobacter sp. YIM 151500-1]
MQETIARLRAEIEAYDLSSPEQLEQFRLAYTGRKGQLADLFDQLKTVPQEDRRAVGQELNQLKQQAVARFEARRQELEQAAANAPADPTFDYTLPPVLNALGTRHPLSLVREEMVRIFSRIGFNVAEGPEIEDDWHNFTALNFPDNHPARDMQDTFFVAGKNGEPEGPRALDESVSAGNTTDTQDPKLLSPQVPNHLLRTHTSTVQVRVMETQPLPIRSIMPGRVYRNEAISARAHMMFHQVEGIYIDENVSFADLKQTVYYFVQEMFGQDIQIRFRPSFFPFTEPSAEIDITCLICKGKGCNICKGSGWVEIGGCGMVDPNVLQNCGIDPERYSGYAWGMGIERITMLKYQIRDLRLFTENDLRFLRQFESA